jgi:hypothetical protein
VADLALLQLLQHVGERAAFQIIVHGLKLLRNQVDRAFFVNPAFSNGIIGVLGSTILTGAEKVPSSSTRPIRASGKIGLASGMMTATSTNFRLIGCHQPQPDSKEE